MSAAPPAREENEAARALVRLRGTKRDPNRFSLVRVPLAQEGEGGVRPVDVARDRRAQSLELKKTSNTLRRWLADEPLLAVSFARPAKETGFDIDGLAVRGERVWLGLRGPVAGGHAAMVALWLGTDDGRRYRLHLLHTGGLGVRELTLDGPDMLVLPGPTMVAEGPGRIPRWRDAVDDASSGVVAPDRLSLLGELPSHAAVDHAQGRAPRPEEGERAFVVISDGPADGRVDHEARPLDTDVVHPAAAPRALSPRAADGQPRPPALHQASGRGRDLRHPAGSPRRMQWSERLFDPDRPGDGPPPRAFAPFARWLIEGAWPTIGLLAALSLAIGVSEAVAAWLIGWVVDEAAGGPAAFFEAHGLALAAIALFFVAVKPGLMIVSSALTSRSLGPGLFHMIVGRLHHHTLGQSVGFFEEDFTGRLAQKQLQTAQALTDSVLEGMNAVGFAAAAALGAIVALGAIDWRLGLVLALWVAVYAAFVGYFLPRIRARSERRAEARAGLSGQLVDSLAHMATVKLFAHAGREEAAATGALARFREAALAFGRTVQAFRAGLAVLGGVLPVLLIGTALALWSNGAASVGAIATAGFLALRLGQMSGWVSFTAMGIFSNVGIIEDGMRTLAKPHDVVDPPAPAPLPRPRGAVAFENVVFRYGRERAGGLEGFSLAIAPGEKVALVGRSGAGKSTALKLLPRLHDVEGGRITVDGVDVREVAQDQLRRRIAMVTQETAMFNRSALDNIRYGNPDATFDEAVEAARQAAAHDFITGLQDRRGRAGYDAHLGENGVKLSGGQRQRIALARAILKDAPVLALDEATAALDSETEAAVQAALERLMAGRTVLAIAHRLSTIASMDRIVVMDHGRIEEEGSHHELLARGGLYADLWAHQSGGFIGLDEAAA